MNVNQMIELWRGLSPRLAKAIPGKELPEGEHADEKKGDEDGENKTIGPVGSHREEDDV